MSTVVRHSALVRSVQFTSVAVSWDGFVRQNAITPAHKHADMTDVWQREDITDGSKQKHEVSRIAESPDVVIPT